MKAVPVLVITILICYISAEQFSYEGYKVYRLQVKNEYGIKTLASFDWDGQIDFWKAAYKNGKPISVMVSPDVQKIFGWFLHLCGIEHQIVIDNVEDLVQKQRASQLTAPPTPEGEITFSKYHSYKEIDQYLEQLAKRFPDFISIDSSAKSYEGRDLKIVKISSGSGQNKPVIFIDAGIHAREWIAPAQALYIIQQLVENPSNADLVKNVDWHILPLSNPDGYEYSLTVERYWRKTRSRGQKCYGVDGNRNFDFYWGKIGGSDRECQYTYIGPAPFSEMETQAIRDYVLKNKDSIKLYITLHSAGEYILYPWGYTNVLPEDHEELQKLGEMVASSIYQVNGTQFTVGSSANVLYPSSGGSDDWAKGVAEIELSYTIELNGGSGDFAPMPNEILTVVEETWNGIKAFHDYIEKKFG